jgi:hypothetical protein
MAHFFELSQRGHAGLVRHEILAGAHNLDAQGCSVSIYASARHQSDIRIVEDASATIEADRLRIARGEIGGEIVLRREKACEGRARANQRIHLAEDVIMVDADDGEADRHVDRAFFQISRIPILSAIVRGSGRLDNTFGTRKMLQELVNASQGRLAVVSGLPPRPY